VKWDGLRAITAISLDLIRIWSRAGRDITAAYPELGALASVAGNRTLVLDGEGQQIRHAQGFGRAQATPQPSLPAFRPADRLAPIRCTPTQSTATHKPSSQPQESPRTTQPVITLNSGDWTDHMG
jgi:hypothetical protein